MNFSLKNVSGRWRLVLYFALFLIVMVLVSVFVLEPVSAFLLKSDVFVLVVLGKLLGFLYTVVIEVPFVHVGPWLYVFFSGNPAAEIPVLLNLILYPFICLGMLVILFAFLVGMGNRGGW